MIEFDVEELKRQQEEDERLARETLEKIKATNRASRILSYGNSLLVFLIFIDTILSHKPVHPGWLLFLATIFFIDGWKVGK